MRKLTLILVPILALSAGTALLSCNRLPGRNTNTQPPKGMIGKTKLDAHWIYISRDIRWGLPPKEITDEMGLFYDGSGSLMVLYPSGELAVIVCELRKDGKTNQLYLGSVFTFEVATGSWSRNSDGTLSTVSRFCKIDVEKSIDKSNEPQVERRCTVGEQSPNRIGGLLTCNQESMVPLPEDFRDLDDIAYMLTFAKGCS